MRTVWDGFHSPLAGQIEQYLATKRALGCKFASEDRMLRLLDRFLVEQHIGSTFAEFPGNTKHNKRHCKGGNRIGKKPSELGHDETELFFYQFHFRLEQLVKQILLAGEMVIDHGLVNSGDPGDLVDAGAAGQRHRHAHLRRDQLQQVADAGLPLRG